MLSNDNLLAAVAVAAADIRQTEEADHEARWAWARIAEMSEREREVLTGILAGQTKNLFAGGTPFGLIVGLQL